MKTNIELARESGLLVIGTADGTDAVYTWPKGITSEIDRYTALVEQRLLAKLLEGVGEPVAWRKLGSDGTWNLYYTNLGWKDPTGFEPLHTAEQVGAAVLAERERNAIGTDKYCGKCLLKPYVNVVIRGATT